MHPHDIPPQQHFIPRSTHYPPSHQQANPAPHAALSQPFHPQSHCSPQDTVPRYHRHPSNHTPRDNNYIAAPAPQTSAFQASSGQLGQFIRQQDDQRPPQHLQQHPQHHDANMYYVGNDPVSQVPVRHILVHQSSHASSSTQQASASSSASPISREAPHTVSAPQQTNTPPNYASEQMHHQREELYLRAITATHKDIADLLSVIQREQFNLRDRLAPQEHSRETNAVQEGEFRSTVISSLQSLQGRLDRIENAIGREPELPPGSKAIGTDKSLKDRLRSTEGMILELLDKTNADILRSRIPRSVTRVIPPTPPPPSTPVLRVDVGVQACPVMTNAAVDVRPPHGLEVYVQTVPIEVVTPPLKSRSEMGIQAGPSNSPLYHPDPPQLAPSFQVPPVIPLNSRFPSSPLTMDTMRPAEWSPEGSNNDGDISPEFSTPQTPLRSVRNITPSPVSQKRTIATQTPSRSVVIGASGSPSRNRTASTAIIPNVSVSSTLIQAEPFSPSQFIRSPSPIHRTTDNPNSARIANLRHELFGEITTESMLQGPLAPQFAEPTRYVNSSSSESENSDQNVSPTAPSPSAQLEPEAPGVYLNDPEPQTTWEGDLFDDPTPVIESNPLPILSPLPITSNLPSNSPPPIIGSKRSHSRTHSFSSLSSLSDISPGHQASRPRIISEESSIIFTASSTTSQVGKLRKRQKDSSSSSTKKRSQGRKSKNQTEPLRPVTPIIEAFNPEVPCQWPEFVEDVEAGMSVQCSGCTSWYHLACAGINENHECLKPENDFFCPPCEKTREIHGRTRKLESIDDSQCARPDCPHPPLADAGAEIFTVEYIIGRQPHHGTDGQEFLWLVKWEGYNASDASWIQPEAFLNGTPDHMVPVFEQRAKEEGHDPSNYGPTILLQEALDWGWR